MLHLKVAVKSLSSHVDDEDMMAVVMVDTGHAAMSCGGKTVCASLLSSMFKAYADGEKIDVTALHCVCFYPKKKKTF